MSEKKAKKTVVLGVEDFKKVIDDNRYYVDKTGYIAELLDGNAIDDAKLFLRPRRFGKTLTLSMLQYFFDMQESANAYLFDGLEITKHRELCDKHQNKYPVISVSFKDVEGTTPEDFLANLNLSLSEEYERHKEALNYVLNENEEEIFKRIAAGHASFSDFKGYFKILIGALCRQYGVKPIVLIDEYDVPLNAASEFGCFQDIVRLLRSMFSFGLKSNKNLQAVIITGCLQIAKNQIFTGFNNLDIYSVVDNNYSSFFGFTEKEVKEMLSYYNIEECVEEVRAFYDGYRIGEKEIYNPFSLLKFILSNDNETKAMCRSYWMNTSGDALLRKMLASTKRNKNLKQTFEKLLSGDAVDLRIDETITYGSMLDNENAIHGTLLFSGYLTIDAANRDGTYRLKVPNKEVLERLGELVDEYNDTEYDKGWPPLVKALIGKDANSATKYITELMRSVLVSRDKDRSENNYHFFLSGVLAMSVHEEWDYISQDPGPDGYADVVLKYSAESIAIVIEEKVLKKDEGRIEMARKAIQQIYERGYDERYVNDGYEVIRYGLVYSDNSAYFLLDDGKGND